MTVEIMLRFLGWSSVFNIVILLIWVGWIILFHDYIFKMHGKWFRLNKEDFGALHYKGLTFYKILILVFNVVPYLVLRMLVDYWT